jgi:Leucine-rich repeat (LRR) protein
MGNFIRKTLLAILIVGGLLRFVTAGHTMQALDQDLSNDLIHFYSPSKKQGAENPINLLPGEIWIHVFGSLPRKDRNKIELVSKNFKTLEQGYISSIKISPSHPEGEAWLLTLSRFINLKRLDLSCCYQIRNSELFYLTSLPNLQELNFFGCKQITSKGLSYLTSLTHLTKLDLGRCNQVADEGLFHLSILINLKGLGVYHCNLITNEGLSHLSRLTNLRRVYLNGCRLRA